jgi:hypothetical protein
MSKAAAAGPIASPLHNHRRTIEIGLRAFPDNGTTRSFFSVDMQARREDIVPIRF